MKKELSFIVIVSITLLLVLPCGTHAQIRLSGVYAFEAAIGGKDSNASLNDLPNEYAQLFVHQFQLFIEDELSRNIFLHAKICKNVSQPPDLKSLDLQLAYCEFSGIAGDALNIAVGKIITPFGTFAKRQLPHDNPLISEPLYFTYPVGVSPAYGLLPETAPSAPSGYGDKAMTMWRGGYTTGIETFGTVIDGVLDYDVALTNAPISSSKVDWNTNRALAVQGRIGVRPAIWIDGGVSYSSGPYIDESSALAYLPKDRIGEFQQRTFGADLRLSYLYYELNAEYLYNNFDSPSYWNVAATPTQPSHLAALPSSEDLTLPSHEIVVDVKVDIPFFPGAYIAGRLNSLQFGNGTYKNSTIPRPTVSWGDNVTRYAAAVGYRMTRTVLLKAEYSTMNIEEYSDLDLRVLAFQLSTSF